MKSIITQAKTTAVSPGQMNDSRFLALMGDNYEKGIYIEKRLLLC